MSGSLSTLSCDFRREHSIAHKCVPWSRIYRLCDLEMQVLIDIAFLLLTQQKLSAFSESFCFLFQVHRSLSFPCPSGPGIALLHANDPSVFLSALTCTPCLPPRGADRLPQTTSSKNWGSLEAASWAPTGQALNSPILLAVLGCFTFLLPQGTVCFHDSCTVCQCEGLEETRLTALQSEKGKVVNFYV